MIVFWKRFQLSLIIGYIYGFWPEVGSLISELALELDALANIDLAEAAGDGRRPVEEIFIWDSRRALSVGERKTQRRPSGQIEPTLISNFEPSTTKFITFKKFHKIFPAITNHKFWKIWFKISKILWFLNYKVFHWAWRIKQSYTLMVYK